MKAKSKVAMKRENGTYVYDIYIKKPDKGNQAVNAVVNQTVNAVNEEGWTTVTHKQYKPKAEFKGRTPAQPERDARTGRNALNERRQPFARLGDNLI